MTWTGCWRPRAFPRAPPRDAMAAAHGTVADPTAAIAERFPGKERLRGFRVAGPAARRPPRRPRATPRGGPQLGAELLARGVGARAPRSPPRGGSTCTRAGKRPRRPDVVALAFGAASRRFASRRRRDFPWRDRPEDATGLERRRLLASVFVEPAGWPRPRTRARASRTPPGASSRGRRAPARWWKPSSAASRAPSANRFDASTGGQRR